MTIRYLCPSDPADTISGGTRKLGDHVAILRAEGFDAEVALEPFHVEQWRPEDLAIVPEVYGWAIDGLPCRRIGFAQNGYLIDDRARGDCPYGTADMLELWVESAHTAALVRLRCPGFTAIRRMHSCGNARLGRYPSWFSFGPWPRRRVVMSFGYKNAAQNLAIRDRAQLPAGWAWESLTGLDDEDIGERMRTGAVFLAACTNEGMCAPTSEALISGCIVVGWPGGPSRFARVTPDWSRAIVGLEGPLAGGPMEYLEGRAIIVAQDDVDGLAAALVTTCEQIDAVPWAWAKVAGTWSEYFVRTYSREREVEDLVRAVEEHHPRA